MRSDVSYTECEVLSVYLCMGFTTTFDLVSETASHFLLLLIDTFEAGVSQTNFLLWVSLILGTTLRFL